MPVPYSDNLYSADSDDELDAISPTDGYFHASSTSDAASSSQQQRQQQHHARTSSVPVVPNVLVEDPSLPENKAREAEAERLNSEAWEGEGEGEGGARRSSQGPVHHHRRSVDEDHESLSLDPPASSTQGGLGPRTPLLPGPIDAPPAYTPSPTTSSRGYQTFAPSASTMGLPEEQQRLIPREPESMGDSPSQDRTHLSRWHRVRKYVHETKDYIVHVRYRRHVKSILGVLLVFSVTVAVIGTLAYDSPHHNHDKVNDKDPVRDPNMDDSKFPWNPLRQCYGKAHEFPKVTVTADMRHDRNLTIIQRPEEDSGKHSGWNPRVWGNVVLRTTTGGSPGSIDVEVISNHEELGVKVSYHDDSGELKVVTPRRVPWSFREAPCIQIRVTVWIPRETVVNTFTIDSWLLGVDIKEGVLMGVLKGAFISTISGDITAPQAPKDGTGVVPYTLDSRHIRVSSISGDIRGWFPLYDLLSMSSSSGDIAASVATKPANPQAPEPAVLDVHTVSGQIVVREALERATQTARPDTRFAPRDYVVKMHTTSGDMTAAVAVSSRGEFVSQSGDLKLRLLPVLDSALLKTEGEKPVLTTDSRSGETSIELLEPVWTSLATTGDAVPPPTAPGGHGPVIIILDPESPPPDVFTTVAPPALSLLTSTHTSISGKLSLRYPSSWEGLLYAQTISGTQEIRGEGLEVAGSGSPYLRHLKGKKGKGSSNLTIETVSGDQDVLIGK